MKYPVRCRIVDPTGEPFGLYMVKKAPEESKSHIGKEGLAEEIDENVRITLDDGTILWGYDCWWEAIKAPVLPLSAQQLISQSGNVNMLEGRIIRLNIGRES